MTDADRDRIRAVQDRWLNLPSIKYQIASHGEGYCICSPWRGVPTFRDVRTLLLPEWEPWFESFWSDE